MRPPMRLAIVGCAVTMFAVACPEMLTAQSASVDTMPPPAAPEDVRSLDAIMTAVYDVISGPVGARNWQRFYSLFAPGARLIPTLRKGTEPIRLEVISPREYVRLYGGYFLKHGFFEREIGRETNTFGPMTQIFSTYESRNASEDPKPYVRGINSFQLLNDGKRWYVVTIYWAEEGSGDVIPGRYLRSDK